ncbi:hypothetical protein BV20DRAFT_959712 [Pilatotrama ljubarskyi]|nr:hypothetical protein BV20DRAFT_959712 [Pilatotrama ljubarskyi]
MSSQQHSLTRTRPVLASRSLLRPPLSPRLLLRLASGPARSAARCSSRWSRLHRAGNIAAASSQSAARSGRDWPMGSSAPIGSQPLVWNGIGLDVRPSSRAVVLETVETRPLPLIKCPTANPDSHSLPTINAPLSPPPSSPLSNMKYRSPSPDNGLPTPPQSPTSLQVAHPATALLESLEQFYQQERYWVHHTRAALELALTKGIDAPSATDAPSPSSSSQSAPSPAPSTASDATAVEAPVVKMETDATLPPPPSRSAAQHNRWMRRKNMMRLKLDGISIHQRKRRPLRAPPTEPAARLLEMFSELMDARMESCQRVQRLVRNAHQADLYMR